MMSHANTLTPAAPACYSSQFPWLRSNNTPPVPICHLQTLHIESSIHRAAPKHTPHTKNDFSTMVRKHHSNKTLQRVHPPCNHQDRRYRPKAKSPALVNINIPSQPPPSTFLSPGVAQSQKPAKYTHIPQSTQTLIKHVRPTGAKHQLQGGLLPLRQARKRPCRAPRPGRPPQSMRPEPHPRRDQGP